MGHLHQVGQPVGSSIRAQAFLCASKSFKSYPEHFVARWHIFFESRISRCLCLVGSNVQALVDTFSQLLTNLDFTASNLNLEHLILEGTCHSSQPNFLSVQNLMKKKTFDGHFV